MALPLQQLLLTLQQYQVSHCSCSCSCSCSLPCSAYPPAFLRLSRPLSALGARYTCLEWKVTSYPPSSLPPPTSSPSPCFYPSLGLSEINPVYNSSLKHSFTGRAGEVHPALRTGGTNSHTNTSVNLSKLARWKTQPCPLPAGI